ncbi:MAG TPA: LTA synthase family protein, partial [Chitinophagaceae bacterium]|nr:LTA synthase family protein [Chitinophagaceae bacterium]
TKAGNKELHWIDDKEALAVMEHYFFGAQYHQTGSIARLQQTRPAFERRNVVLVIMESMAAHRMKRFGNDQGLTPFLDSLADKSWCFDSTFSAGIHTYNGIYATLFGHPALMKRHSLDMLSVPRMSGLPNVLAGQGYQNIFFTTHDEQFDNMSGFLLANSFHTVIGQKDYPLAEIKSSMGVPDEFMFRFAIPRLNALAANGKPFFAALMTGSNHDPRIIPENTGFVRRLPFQELAVIEYADWSVRKLMTYAEKQTWYNNTVFVFVADHGVPLWHDLYDIPFTFHHIPFFIFAPGANRTDTYKKLALQTDVFPTVMSLISKPYQNNTFGIDLFTETHRNIVFSSDDVLACMNDSLLYVYRENQAASLYRFRKGDKTDYRDQMPGVTDSMSKLAFAWLQTSQWILNHANNSAPQMQRTP